MEEKLKTYVWNPLHKNHQFKKAGIHPTWLGILYVWKCEKCGDIEIKIEKSGGQKIRMNTNPR